MSIALRPGSFFGDTVSMVVADAILSEVRHSTGRTVPPHTHEYPYFSLLVEGAYCETSDGVTIDYDPFTVVFHAARREHTDTIGPAGAKFFMLELLRRWSETAGDDFELPAHFTEMNGGNAAWLMSRLYQEFLTGATTEFAVESLLYELCTALDPLEANGAEPPWMAELDNMIHYDLGRGMTVRSLADAVGVNASHLCRVFRRFRRRTIGDYVIGLRMQLACRRIVETQRPIGEIAAEVGFADQSHMTRVFKRFVGQTPRVYRKRIQNRFADPAKK